MKTSNLLHQEYQNLNALVEDLQLPFAVVKTWLNGESEPHPIMRKAISDYFRTKNDNELENLVHNISLILNEFDFQGLLKCGSPIDEYYHEALKIARSLPMCSSAADLQELIWAVFILQFSPTSAGEVHEYKAAAEKIFELKYSSI